MLTDDLRKSLSAVLLDRLSVSVNAVVVRTYVGDAIALRLPANLTRVADYAEWMIDETLSQPTSAEFVKLVRAVSDAAIIAAKIATLVQLAGNLESGATTWVPVGLQSRVDWKLEQDPCEAGEGEPFLNRKNFRELLPRLPPDLPPAPACTVVSADRGHGKTYLRDYCRYYASQWGDLNVITSAVPSSGVPSLTPDMVADEIASRLGTKQTRRPRKHESDNRRGEDLADWIVSFTPKRAVPPLVMLDGYDHTDLPASVHAFILELVKRTTSDAEVAASRLRLVLLGYPAGKLQEHNITKHTPCILGFVDKEDVRAWFVRKFPGLPDYIYDDTTDAVLDGVPNNGELRMRMLCTKVRTAALELKEEMAA